MNKPASTQWRDVPVSFLAKCLAVINEKCPPPSVNTTNLADEKGRLAIAFELGRRSVFDEIKDSIDKRNKHEFVFAKAAADPSAAGTG